MASRSQANKEESQHVEIVCAARILKLVSSNLAENHSFDYSRGVGRGMMEVEIKVHWLLVGSCLDSVTVVDFDCKIQKINLAASFFNSPAQDSKIIDVLAEAVPGKGVILVVPQDAPIVNVSAIKQ